MNTNELLHEEGHSTHSFTHSTHSGFEHHQGGSRRIFNSKLFFSSIDTEIEFIWLLPQAAGAAEGCCRTLNAGGVAMKHKQRPDSGASRLWNFSFSYIINHKRQYLPQSPPIKLFCHYERFGIWARLHRWGLGALRHSETVSVMPNFKKVIKIVWHTEYFSFFERENKQTKETLWYLHSAGEQIVHERQRTGK